MYGPRYAAGSSVQATRKNIILYFILLVLGALSRFLEQPVQVIYLLIFYVNIFHHINIGGKSLYISHII